MNIKKKIVHLLGGIMPYEIKKPKIEHKQKIDIAEIIGEVELDYFTINNIIRKKSKDNANKAIKKIILDNMDIEKYIRVESIEDEYKRTRRYRGTINIVKRGV